MNPSSWSAERILQDRATLIAVAAVAAVLFAVTNLPWQLDDFDQAQQAFTSYEMVNEGHWLYQRTPHELIAQKPPLIGWLSAGIFATTRSWEVAWRLPSFLSAIALAVILFRAAAAAYGSVAALVAFSAFGLNLMTVRLATLVRTDMPLALVIFLAGLLIFEHIRHGRAWRTYERALFCALLALSMWIKGPFIYVFLLPAIVLFRWRWRGQGIVGAWPGWWPWMVSLLLFLPWVVGGLRAFPTFYEQVIAFEVLGRFSTAVHRAQPVYFYLLHLLHKLAPWSLLLVALPIGQLRGGSQSLRRAAMAISPATFWLIVWGLSGFVVMSLIPSKRVDRVYAVVPPLCLLLAAQVSNGWRSERLRHRTSVTLVACLFAAVAFTTGYAGWKISYSYHDHADALVLFAHQLKAEARLHHWRYEVISGTAGSEGMLLYLEKLYFIEPDEAVQAWNKGNLDALAIPLSISGDVLPRLRSAEISPLRSAHRASQPKVDYQLVFRRDAVPAD